MSKNKKNKVKINTTSDLEISKILKISIVVFVVLLLTYLLAGIITGEIKFGKDKEEETVTEIQYEEILGGQALQMSSDDYYVLYFNFTANIASSYLTFKDTYTSKDDSLAFYIIDLEKGFNQKYVREENEEFVEYPSNVSDIKVVNPTILKVSGNKVVERTEGISNVLNYLTEITK